MSRDNKIGFIYCLKCPITNNIRYIGQTIQKADTRLKQHLWHSTKHKNHLGNWLNSLKEKPIIEVIEECVCSDLNKRELYWIDFYKTNKLVNSMKGCKISGHHTHSDETKKKIGLATTRIHTGMKRSEETKKKISENRKRFIGKCHPRYGTKQSIEEIQKRVIKIRKKIIQLTLDGKEIRVFDSLSSITKELGFNFSNISTCCRGKQKTAYGYKWKFKN